MRITIALSALLPIFLSACGGGSSTPASMNPEDPATTNRVTGAISGNVKHLGIVGVEAFTSDNEVEAFGTFFEYPNTLAGELFNDAFNPTLDTCIVDVFEELEGNTQSPEINSTAVPTLVSAGEVLNLSSQAGSYLDLQRQTQAGIQFYGDDQGAITGSLPSQLTLDIPGDTFPAFSNISFPTVEPLVIITPILGETITANTGFSWTPGTNPDAHILISATEFSASGEGVTIECLVRDNGVYAFSPEIKTELGDDFFAFSANVSREASAVFQRGNALLILTASSLE